MTYEIEKRFRFAASHQLAGLSPDHPCSRLHGHNFEITVMFRSPILNAVGFVVDYRDLETIRAWIDGTLDHRHLNDVMTVNPTSENLAKFLFDEFKPIYRTLFSVTVSETDKTSATYKP